MRRGSDPPASHCLLLDRRDRRLYVAERDQAMILFALIEPEEGDAHNVYVDGMLMSPGSEGIPGTGLGAPERAALYSRYCLMARR